MVRNEDVTAEPPAGVTYDIGPDDVIVSVGGNWNAFAVANDSGSLCAGVVGRPIWDFLDGLTPREVYRDLFARVRQGKTVHFPFRCDSPTCARHMVMRMTPLDNRGVRFETSMIRAIPLMGVRGTEPIDSLVRVCSWCKRVALPPTSEWLDPEVAVARYRLLDRDEPVRLTHGICEPCIAMLGVDIGEP